MSNLAAVSFASGADFDALVADEPSILSNLLSTNLGLTTLAGIDEPAVTFGGLRKPAAPRPTG